MVRVLGQGKRVRWRDFRVGAHFDGLRSSRSTDHLSVALCISISLIDAAFGQPNEHENLSPEKEKDVTEAKGQPAETRVDIGSPTRARTWDLRINSP